MNKYLLLLSVLMLGIAQTGVAAVNTISNSTLTYSRANISNSYDSSQNRYSTSYGSVKPTYVDKPTEDSIISYKNTTTDELESDKYKSVTVMNSYETVHPTLIMTISNSPSKNPKNSTVIFSHVLKGSRASCYRGCSLMIKFDDKEAKKYEFKSDITSNFYILNSSYNKDFIDNVKNSKVLKTKISFATFNLPIENIDFKKIEF